MRSKQFGGKLTKVWANEYQKSRNWIDGKFQNIEPTSLNISLSKVPGLIYNQFKNRDLREPSNPLPIAAFNKSDFLETSENAKFIWYGHSVVLMRINNQTLLIDPMLGSDSSPIGPITTKRYSKDTLNLIDDFPEIDLLLLTHDHYDHLDLASIQKLRHKTKKYFVALGVKRHLVQWGISADLITEFDWWNTTIFENIDITFTPTRHFSGRGFTDRAKSLWGGWAFKTSTENIWFSGDSGYGKHFIEVGEKLGSFDFAFMECGQYNENWHQIHMYPEESVQAAIDANVKKMMPVHWAGFSLSLHSWTDPAERFAREAEKLNKKLSLPTLGQLFSVSDTINLKWWEGFK